MAELTSKAVLTVKGKDYAVLSYSQSMRRNIGQNGKPTGGVIGGEIYLTVDSDTESNALSEYFLTDTKFDGTIQLKKADTKTNLRDLKFKGAYIVSLQDALLPGNHLRQDIHISADELTIGSADHKNNWEQS
ncbi:type VI secretion system tube protein TssD [Pedobacter sp. MC2016-15]|uniref:type VI secretion system tube protein TssD n=1 Tax=Pedobacter sp. MC2016-15 TaxID=2994473 RepID=UPI002247798D|nr:type VI secretion system tube protein TssD [Pedobacter sp. MC2016-15]MCX2478067.1 type VI secretion system tube protein TssD [Pedobacter sp. MC2016-15]